MDNGMQIAGSQNKIEEYEIMGLMLLSTGILRPQASKHYSDDLESSLRLQNIKLADFPGGVEGQQSQFFSSKQTGEMFLICISDFFLQK